jgi:hypothetical protein
MRSCRYQYPEYLSSTDSVVVALRRLVAEHGRGNERDVAVVEETTAERLVRESEELFKDAGVKAAAEIEAGSSSNS